MAAPSQDRNFRSFYYEKLCVRGIEEKKSIEILFNEKQIDVEKLSEFCLRFPVPAAHRPQAWKIILEVLPRSPESFDFSIQQLEETYQDLIRALKVTGQVNDLTPKPDQFLKMYLLSEGKIKLSDDLQFTKPDVQQFLTIVTVFCAILNDDLDIFYLTVAFYKLRIKGLVEKNSAALHELFVSLLAKKDAELHEHLKRISALDRLPVMNWFSCCFAGTLHDSSIARVWDKVVGGSCKILSYVSCSLVISSKETLLGLHTAQEVSSHVFLLPEEVSESVAGQALDTWKELAEIRRAKN